MRKWVHRWGDSDERAELVLNARAAGWCSDGDARDARAMPPVVPNVFLGVSVENQGWADNRIPLLMDTPAARRFVSCEPLLGAVDLRPWLGHAPRCGCLGCHNVRAGTITPPRWWGDPHPLSWVIVGGESGPHHRPLNPDWVKDMAAHCGAANTPIFVKQGSGTRPGKQGDIPDELWALKENIHVE